LAAWRPFKLSPIHRRHLALGARMMEEEGWWRPEAYTSPAEEVAMVRRSVGIIDVSPRAKLDLKGEDVQSTLNRSFQNPPSLVGRAAPCLIPALPSPITCCKLCDDQALLISEPGSHRALIDHLSRLSESSPCAHLTDLTSALAGICVAGPMSRQVLSKLTELDLAEGDFPNLSCAQGKLANVHALVIRADNGAGPAYDVYFGREYGEFVWEAIMEAGEEFRIQPFGLKALELLRGGA